MAGTLAAAVSSAGMDARLVETKDTADELERLNTGTVDFAVVSGAYRIESYEHLREVAPLQVEALHLLVKEELAAAVGPTLRGLRGRTVDLGPPGSPTDSIAWALLRFAVFSIGDRGTPNALVP